MKKIEYIKALKGAKPVPGGSSRIYKGPAQRKDGSHVTVFLKDNSFQELANELLASQLGRSLGLPIPNCFVAVCEDTVLPAFKAPFGKKQGTRYWFAIEEESADNLTTFFGSNLQNYQSSSITKKLRSWSHIGKALLFDAWVANIDRNTGNLLYRAPDSFFLIDHGQCFTGPSWSPAALDPVGQFSNKMSGGLAVGMNQAEIDQLFNLSIASLPDIMKVPIGNATDAALLPVFLPSGFVPALNSFLTKRLAYTKDALKMALKATGP